MPRPALRSRSFVRKKIRTPAGVQRIHYSKRKHSPALCAICKKPLHGVPKARDAGMANLTRRQKRPERPFGGNLCSSCMRERIKAGVR
ncbi:MAG TPA: 50S ribosomal protein L34e [archaeon]|jgi:large subunit ribosomal protein L34e|nr:50S ribosomal protein L34e [archaeon]